MAQKKENRACSADSIQLIPKASTDISSGDVVVLARKNDPISLSALGAAGRCSPIAAARQGQWSVGVSDEVFTSAVVGATDYAAPDADNKIKILREGQGFFFIAYAVLGALQKKMSDKTGTLPGAEFRAAVKIADELGLYVTFMPKPMYKIAGSGMHVHQFVEKNGQSIFPGDELYGLSTAGLQYTAGVLSHALSGSLLAWSNPSTNSYRRLVAGYEAPVSATFAKASRAAAASVTGVPTTTPALLMSVAALLAGATTVTRYSG